MTAPTATRPAPPGPSPRTPPPGPDRPVAARAVDDGTGAATLLGEALLMVTTIVAVLGFRRVFREADAVTPLVVAAVVAHAIAVACRRLGLRLAVTALVTVVALVLQVSLTHYWSTSWLGLPTPSMLDALWADLERAMDLFGEVKAPAPRARGFLVAATVAVWAAASLADWAAFRVRAVAEAVLPALSLFVFTVILGEGAGGVALAAALAGSAFGFALAQRAVRDARTPWMGDARRGRRSRAGAGAVLGLVAVVVAAVIVPRLPGATTEGLVDWRSDGPGHRLTVSPLVDIRSRLVQQTDTVVFTVESERPAYWRLTSLDRFDGTVWSSSERFSRADGRLPSMPPDAATRRLDQRFRIRSLGSIWAPAALTPVEVARASTPLRWNGRLATLIVPEAVDSVDGATYLVTSEVPDFEVDDLQRRLPDPLPSELAESIALPPGIRPVVADLAFDAVREAEPTPYARAKALQDWFRTSFEYDISGVGSGHGRDAMSAFLDARRGYCEQFAGTFAAMARTLGIPARVAVGFTPGEVGDDDVTYTVRGRNAHAWPEVYIPGAGWVPFEPTPGRGQPGTEVYTGVGAQQAESVPLPTTTTTAATTSTPLSTPAPAGVDPEISTGPGPTTVEAESSRSPVATGIGAVALVVVGLVLLDVVVLAALRALRRRRRRAGRTVAARVRAAWADAVETVARAGPRPRPSETAREYADRAAPVLGPDAPALHRLAVLTTAATWSADRAAARSADAAEADDLAARVAHRVRHQQTWDQRLRSAVDPRQHLWGWERT